MSFSGVERWVQSNATLRIDLSNVNNRNTRPLFELCKEVTCDDNTTIRCLSIRRTEIITAVIVEFVVANVWEKTSKLYIDIKAPCAQRYEERLSEYIDFCAQNPADWLQRRSKTSELARLAVQVPLITDFYTSWLNWKADAITDRLIKLVSCVIPSEQLGTAQVSLCVTVKSAIRMSVRMRTEEYDWEFRHLRHANHINGQHMVIRNTNPADPEHDHEMVDMCISPGILAKKYNEPGSKTPSTAERMYRAEVFAIHKQQQRRP